MSTEKPRRLGRGLDALLGTRPLVGAAGTSEPATRTEAPAPRSGLRQLAVSQIRPNPLQPRKEFVEADLADLEASIKANGLLQPVTVRPAGDGFELIAGERRFRAMQRLGWSEVPAIVRDIDDQALLTLALVENLQRADLNPIEEAEGYQQLMAQFQLTQQQVADVVGKDRSTIANTLRLLGLPLPVRAMVREGKLSVGHARALLSLSDDAAILTMAKTVIADGLNVRDVERMVREAGTARSAPKSTAATPATPATDRLPPAVKRIEDELRRHLQTDVKIHLGGADRGDIRIAFYSADDLERVLDLVLGAAREQL
jgi:ParB family chromosome partitioning protein